MALVLLSAVFALNMFDRVLISVVAAPIKQEFGLSDTELGLLTGPAFVSVYVIFSIASGWVSDQFNRRGLLIAALTVWSAITILCGMARNFSQLAICRVGVGIGEGGCSPASYSLLADYYPAPRRAFAWGVFHSAGMLGILLSFLVGGHVASVYGWRTAFFIGGFPGLVLAVILVFWRGDAERGRLDEKQAGDALSEGAITLLRNNPALLWLLMAAGLGSFATMGMIQWLPQFFIRSHGMDIGDVAMFFGPALACGMMAGPLIGGALGDRLFRRSNTAPVIFCAYATLAVVPLYWLVLWLGSNNAALAMTFVASGVATCAAPVYTAAISNASPAGNRGLATALLLLVTSVIGQAVIPLVVGMLSDFLEPSQANEALRYALSSVLVVNIAAAAAFFRATYWLTRMREISKAKFARDYSGTASI